jgi:hypothetical protein
MIWQLSNRADRCAALIADRHYNRQKPGSRQFVPPGRCLVLLSSDRSSVWVTSWPFAQFVKHRWRGAWVCSLFRKEGHAWLASDMIQAAVAATRWRWPEIPDLGMVTFINTRFVKPEIRRGVETYGHTWKRAGFQPDGMTKGGLMAFRIDPGMMPEAVAPDGLLYNNPAGFSNLTLFD